MSTQPLTPRQLTACALYAQGLRTREVAERMGIVESAANHYLGEAKLRMGARHLGHLMFLLGREVRES